MHKTMALCTVSLRRSFLFTPTNFFKNKRSMKLLTSVLLFFILLTCASCVSQKKMIYLQGADYLQDNPQQIKENFELKIQSDDQLAISISSKDRELIEPFNNNTLIGSGSGMNSQYNSQAGVSYFQVDKDGNIEFPIFGTLKASGLTRMELAKVLENRLISQNYIKDPLVSIKIMSFKVTVLGEVKAPGVQNVTGERLTLLEALGMAGDLLPSARRENIMVIREEDGKRKSYMVDLTSSYDVLNSPCYYLQQNDVVYVEPNSAIRVKGSGTMSTVTSTVGMISMLASLVSIIIALSR